MWIDRIIETLWQSERQDEHGRVYAVLDAARDEAVLPFLLSNEVRHECLYEGPLPREILAVAPYLVPLEREKPFTRELLKQAWGRSWGLFVTAFEDASTVRRHLRHFLKVKDEQGKRLYFRFYDPRVMRVFLPTCTPYELKALFGPLGSWSMEGPEGATLMRYEFQPTSKLTLQKLELTSRKR
ncbi:DUF4123 domain-containing protein [Hyalangium versicolor]|uniref:DUF4123 domain-containing protein n=1 Tax=Hyalangium versicolor TaxID=2861190 RepID=UPI001CCFC814|nr:DUF4123 domain-containing protein [Hyalangium versicolor]